MPAAPQESTRGMGRLVMLWYAGMAIAALFMHWAMANAASVVLSSAFAAGAVAVPLTLLGYTMRSYGDELNSQILVPAIGPIVIAVLILEYVEYNKRVDDAHAAELIPADLLVISDVKFSVGTGRLSGHVVNRSPHQLLGMNVEVALYGGREQLSSTEAEANLDLAPGQQGNFTSPTPYLALAGGGELPCTRTDDLPAPGRGGNRATFECFYRVTATRGEEVFF